MNRPITSLSGTLLNSEKAARNKQVTLVLCATQPWKKNSDKSSDTGNLRIDNPTFFDSVTVYYQLVTNQQRKRRISLDLVVTL